MSNEFTGADLAPHMVYGLTLTKKVDVTATGANTIVLGGNHGKMRLRSGYIMVVDAALSVADYVIDIKHGAQDAVAAVSSGSTTSAIGTVKELTVVETYKDCEADDAVIVQVDTASTTGDVMVTLMYELVE